MVVTSQSNAPSPKCDSFPSFPKGYRTEINEKKIVSLVEEAARLSLIHLALFLIVSETFFMDVNFSRKSVSNVC